MLGAAAGPVEHRGEPLWPVLRVLPVGNDGRSGSLFPGELPVFGAVMASVGDNGIGSDIGADVHQGLEMWAVGRLAADTCARVAVESNI